jgi:hypothetical protein
MGIEPTSEAWEASILPLYDARSGANFTRISPTFGARKEAAALDLRRVEAREDFSRGLECR